MIYTLVFDRDLGLQKIVVALKTIQGDITGSKGLEQYSSYKEILTKKHGEPLSLEVTGLALYDDPDEFWQCLRYDGCGAYFSAYDLGDKGSVGIKLLGQGRGTGYLQLSFEGPKWLEAMDRVKNQAQEELLDAL